MILRGQSNIVYAIWGILIAVFLASLVTARWEQALVSLATLGLSILPSLFAHQFRIRLPVRFFAFSVLFIFAAIFLGEAFDFYERYWWWDTVLHAGSAVGFGLIGFLFVFMLFEGDRYAAPPSAIAFIAACFAITIGVAWEIFEFGMDKVFGLDMQKKVGEIDTMSDLIVNALGATLGALSGFFYLKGWRFGGLAGMIHDFVRQNERLYRKLRDKRKE